MLGDIRQAKNVYIVTGYTDMRKGARSMVPYVMQNFKRDPYESSLFLFCGKKCDRLKAFLWEPDGFVLLYKVLNFAPALATSSSIVATKCTVYFPTECGGANNCGQECEGCEYHLKVLFNADILIL